MSVPVGGVPLGVGGIGGQRPTQAPIEAFGGGAGAARVHEAAGQTARTSEQIVQDKLDRILQAQVDDSVADIDDAVAKETTAIKSLRGIDAYEASRSGLANLDKSYEGIRKRSTNPIVARAVEGRYKQRRDNFYLDTQKYGNDQALWSANQSTLARIEKTRNAAIANGSPQAIAAGIQETNDGLARYARDNGHPKEWLEVEQAKNTSGIHTNILERMLDGGNDLAAKAYYEANKDALFGDDAKRMAKMVQNESTLGESYRLADVVLSYEPETLQDALTHLDKIVEGDKLPPEIRAKASQIISQRQAIAQDAKEQRHRADLSEAKNIIDGGKSYDDIPATLRARMDATDERELRKYSAKEPVTDNAAWYSLNIMASSEETREQFKRLNLMKYVNQLSRSDFQEVAKLQAGLIKGDGKTTREANGFRTTAAIVTGAAKKSNLSKKDTEDFVRLMETWVRQYKIDKKTDFVPENEVVDEADRLLKREDEDAIFMKGDRIFRKILKDKAEYDKQAPDRQDVFSKMSEEDYQVVVSRMESRSIPFTDENMLQVYEALLKDKANRAGK